MFELGNFIFATSRSGLIVFQNVFLSNINSICIVWSVWFQLLRRKTLFACDFLKVICFYTEDKSLNIKKERI
jgi:hypothetical protein